MKVDKHHYKVCSNRYGSIFFNKNQNGPDASLITPSFTCITNTVRGLSASNLKLQQARHGRHDVTIRLWWPCYFSKFINHIQNVPDPNLTYILPGHRLS